MLVPVRPLTDLPNREGYLFRHGPHQVALFRVDDEVSAIDNVCPHAGADLASGDTDGLSVACPWHCWEFDTRTGECRTVSNYDVDTYQVIIEDGLVKIELPD